MRQNAGLDETKESLPNYSLTLSPRPALLVRYCNTLTQEMTKIPRGRRRLLSRQLRPTPYPIPSYSWEGPEEAAGPKQAPLALEKKDWEDATCSVCMEFPHNAVLLLCSSYDKGCRPYMCGTSCRHSNCLDQFKKAYSKESIADTPMLSLPGWTASEKPEVMELACPLCRGQVKGWTVVEPAREFLDNKKRSCMQENCPFAGTYRELRKHVRSEHPSAKPREVDPALEQKWRTLERDRERQDVISTIRSSMPGSVVLGDYVIEMNRDEFDSDGEGGDVDGADFDGGGGGGRGISRSILYFFLREGARLMRFHRENGTSEEDDGGQVPHGDGGDDADVGVAFSEGDDVDDVDIVNHQGRGRRRRRRRGQGGTIYDIG